MTSMTSTPDKQPTGGSRVSSDGHDLVIDVRGLSPLQRTRVDVIIRAMLAGLLAAGTPAELAEEAARRLTVSARG